ncbi:MAG: hypothetical protein HUJ68_12465 [Clostridia bacterium]|nr:hypothetical protein [Clostridia bacterium]
MKLDAYKTKDDALLRKWWKGLENAINPKKDPFVNSFGSSVIVKHDGTTAFKIYDIDDEKKIMDAVNLYNVSNQYCTFKNITMKAKKFGTDSVDLEVNLGDCEIGDSLKESKLNEGCDPSDYYEDHECTNCGDTPAQNYILGDWYCDSCADHERRKLGWPDRIKESKIKNFIEDVFEYVEKQCDSGEWYTSNVRRIIKEYLEDIGKDIPDDGVDALVVEVKNMYESLYD